jgi:hypothetical protein
MILIAFLLEHGSNPRLVNDLINSKNFKQKQGFFIRLFRNKAFESRFILSLTIKIAGFSAFNKDEQEFKNIEKTL